MSCCELDCKESTGMPFKPGMLDAEARAKWVAMLRQAVAASETTATDTCFFIRFLCT